MEDESGLELSLGLSCGASSAKSKGAQKQDSGPGSQKSDSAKPSENFFNNLSKVNVDADTSRNANNNRSSDIEDDKRSESGSKRKMLFDEISNQKRHERGTRHGDEKSKVSHISITTDDGSTADNEDVADSEVGSTSKRIVHHDDGSKRFTGGASSEAQKEGRVLADSSASDSHGQKRFNMPYLYPVQSANVLNPAYLISMKDANPAAVPSSSGHPLTSVMHIMPTTTNERPGTQLNNPGNSPVTFGYSAVQLPILDKDNPWGIVSHPPQFHPSYSGRGPLYSDKHSDGLRLSPGPVQDRTRGQHTTEEGSSSRAEEELKGSSANLRENNASDRPSPEGFSLDFSAIKPGIAADLNFGGSGSYPNLPWVSTTGSGPHGRTISGVTYRYSANQIRIVCACHGTHMSPEEFVRHASEEYVNPENNGGLATFTNTNPAASAQS